MEWIELIIHTTTAGSEPVSDILMESGASGTMIEDKADIPDPSKPHGIWEIIDPKLLETMPEEYRYVWKRLCEGVSQRQLAKELGYKSHAGFRQKFMCRFKAEFVKAGIRRSETKGGCVRQINVE